MCVIVSDGEAISKEKEKIESGERERERMSKTLELKKSIH